MGRGSTLHGIGNPLVYECVYVLGEWVKVLKVLFGHSPFTIWVITELEGILLNNPQNILKHGVSE